MRRINRAYGLVAVCLMLLPASPCALALDVATPYVHPETFWSHGYTGTGIEVGVLDLQMAQYTHPALADGFRGAINFSKPPALVSNHATAVAGAALSRNATCRGVAPGAGFWTGQTATRRNTTTFRTETVAAETFGQGLDDLAGNPVEVITLSIGVDGNTTGDDQWSLALDHVADTNARTITIAAGNSGPGYDSLDGPPAGAYNAIVVGATGDDLTDYSHMASYSSRGYTSNGRCKPDLVAPGTNLILPILGGAWGEGSGTSFATPMVAGGAAMLIDMGQDLGYATDSRVIKSVLLNSADKLDGWSHTGTHPLDRGQGAGQMNLRKAYRQYQFGEKTAGDVSGIGWDLAQVSAGIEQTYDLDLALPAGAAITATLTWNRIVSTNTEDIDEVIYSLHHLANLDLHLYDQANPLSPLVSSASAVDNVEHIYYTVAGGGQFRLGVENTGPWSNELFSLSWWVAPAEGLDFPGDANLDGVVNVGDLGILAGGWGASDRTWFEGDFNLDGLVDVGDLGMLAGNWGLPAPPGYAAVPEPLTAMLMLLGLAALLRRADRVG